MQRSQVPPRRNVPLAKLGPLPKITVTITGKGQGIGKTQLADYVHHALRNWFPKGIERPPVVVVDAEHRKLVEFDDAHETDQLDKLLYAYGQEAFNCNIGDTLYDLQSFKDVREYVQSVVNLREAAEHEIKINLPGLIYKEDAERRAFRQGGFAEDTAAFRSATEVPAVATSGNALTSVPVVPGYTSLLGVLMEALNQAQYGKGADRHNLGGDIPFERQRMQQISSLIGSPDGMVYQACKKITEGMELPTLDRQVAELLGAINYLAGIVIFLRKRDSEETVVGALAKKSESQARLLETMKASPDECAANGEGCSYGPHGPNGETQCRYCGEQQPLKPYVDPVMREYPKTPTTGWVANCVNDLFGTLDALAYELRDNPAVQRLARVWRKNSPILMAIDRHRDLIDNTIQSPDIDPAAAPWVDSDIDPNEAAENHLRKMGIPT